MSLTELAIKTLKVPETNPKIYYDEVVPGFGVRVTKSGAKSFVLTHGRTRNRETIGRVGVITLRDARKVAKEKLAAYTLGKHKAVSITWNGALTIYLKQVKENRKASTFVEYNRLLKRYFKFGDTKLHQITPSDIQTKLDKISGSERFHAYVVVRAFIRWCHRRHYFDANPMERMIAPEGPKARERILSDEELKKVWCGAGTDTFGSIIKLLILTGQRRGEISSLMPAMVGEDMITLPAWLTKNGREHTIPLAKAALDVLSTASQNVTPSTLIFAARGTTDKPFSGWSKAKAALDERSTVTDWTIHDLRRTFASRLASLGVSLPVIEKLLNHISGSFGGIVGVYQRYDFMPEMREAVVKWGAYIHKLVDTP